MPPKYVYIVRPEDTRLSEPTVLEFIDASFIFPIRGPRELFGAKILKKEREGTSSDLVLYQDVIVVSEYLRHSNDANKSENYPYNKLVDLNTTILASDCKGVFSFIVDEKIELLPATPPQSNEEILSQIEGLLKLMKK